VIRERLQGSFRHRIHRERRGKGLDVKNIGRFGVLGSGAGPKKPLRTHAGIESALPARRIEQRPVRLVGTLGDGDAKLVAKRVRHVVLDRYVPAADKNRSHRTDNRRQPGLDAPLNTPQKCLSSRNVLLAGEQQSHVDRDSREDRFLDRRQTFLRPWNLDEQVRLSSSRVQILGCRKCAGCVVRQQR